MHKYVRQVLQYVIYIRGDSIWECNYYLPFEMDIGKIITIRYCSKVVLRLYIVHHTFKEICSVIFPPNCVIKVTCCSVIVCGKDLNIYRRYTIGLPINLFSLRSRIKVYVRSRRMVCTQVQLEIHRMSSTEGFDWYNRFWENCARLYSVVSV